MINGLQKRGVTLETVWTRFRLLLLFKEKKLLFIITLSGLCYNVGMIAGPWFDGQLAQSLYDMFGGTKEASDMYALCLMYALVIIAVQSLRYVKRLYVRKFANNVSLTMKDLLYQQLVQTPTAAMEREHTGTLMTKVISDIDTCVEGMRKFTTEVFDTGVVMVTYLVMLLVYDWKLTLCILVFPPLAYFLANRCGDWSRKRLPAAKKASGALSGITLDRISNALTYRVYGEETVQNAQYERYLKDYEQKMILANLWENTMQPIYKIIAMTGTISSSGSAAATSSERAGKCGTSLPFRRTCLVSSRCPSRRPMQPACSMPSRRPRSHGAASSPVCSLPAPTGTGARPFRRQPLRSAICPFPMTRAISRLSRPVFFCQPRRHHRHHRPRGLWKIDTGPHLPR